MPDNPEMRPELLSPVKEFAARPGSLVDGMSAFPERQPMSQQLLPLIVIGAGWALTAAGALISILVLKARLRASNAGWASALERWQEQCRRFAAFDHDGDGYPGGSRPKVLKGPCGESYTMGERAK